MLLILSLASAPTHYYTNNARTHGIAFKTEAFDRFGGIAKVWIARNPPGFAFVWFDDPRDADDAAREMNEAKIGRCTLRVELARPPGSGKGGKGKGKGGKGGYDDDRGYDRRDRDDRDYDDRPRRESFDDRGGKGGKGGQFSKNLAARVRISGLPPQCDWRELKDFCRQAGPVTYANVDQARDTCDISGVQHEVLKSFLARWWRCHWF